MSRDLVECFVLSGEEQAVYQMQLGSRVSSAKGTSPAGAEDAIAEPHFFWQKDISLWRPTVSFRPRTLPQNEAAYNAMIEGDWPL